MHRSLQAWEIEQLQHGLLNLVHSESPGTPPSRSVTPEDGGSPCGIAPSMQFSSRAPRDSADAGAEQAGSNNLFLAAKLEADEIRAHVFQSRRWSVRQKTSWLERAFVRWDWAFSERKTLKCRVARHSQTRYRRTTLLTMAEWRGAASKVRRRRRLGLIFVTRNMDLMASLVLHAWLQMVQTTRKFAKLKTRFQDNQEHKCFDTWARHHRQTKTFQARVCQCLRVIDRRAVLRGVAGWRDIVRGKRKLAKQAQTAMMILRSNEFNRHFREWRAVVIRSRHLNNQDGETSRTLHLLLQRSCSPVFCAWRKQAKHGKGFKDDSLEGIAVQWIESKPTDQMSKRIINQRHAAVWLHMARSLLRTGKAHNDSVRAALNPFYLSWAAIAVRKSVNRQRTRLLLQKRAGRQQSIIAYEWKSLAARNLLNSVNSCKIHSRNRLSLHRKVLDAWRCSRAYRAHLKQSESLAASVWSRLYVQNAFKTWYQIARAKRMWRHLLKVLASITENRQRSLLLAAFWRFEDRTLVSPIVEKRVVQRVQYRGKMLIINFFGDWWALMRNKRFFKNTQNVLKVRSDSQKSQVCMFLWSWDISARKIRKQKVVFGRQRRVVRCVRRALWVWMENMETSVALARRRFKVRVHVCVCV